MTLFAAWHRKYAFISMLFFGLSGTLAQSAETTPSPAKILEKHDSLFTNHDSLTVQFAQTIYRKLRNKTIERKGVASFAKPNKFYWLFENENLGNEEYFYDGKELSHYLAKDKMVQHYGSTSSLSNQLQDIIDMVLDGNKLLTRYTAKSVTTEKDNTLATLVPTANDPGNEIQKIEVKVSDKRTFIKEIKIMYNDEGYSLFRFKNPRTSEISADRFVFHKPEGATVTEKIVP